MILKWFKSQNNVWLSTRFGTCIFKCCLCKKTKLSSIQFTKFLPLAFKDYIGWLMLESIECRWKFIDEFSRCCYDTQHSWICCKCCRAEYWNEKWTWRSINILSINKLTYVINFCWSHQFLQYWREFFVETSMSEMFMSFLSNAHYSLMPL